MPRSRVEEDQLSFQWKTPRPNYMREIEPLAHEGAWPSADPWPVAGVADPPLTPEQKLNRQLFQEGRNRRQPSAVSSQLSANAERKTG